MRLVGLRNEFLMPDGDKDDWEWPWDARAGYIVQACSLCAAQRGTRSPAWLILPDPWHVCLRHHRWTDNSRSTQHPYIDLSNFKDVIRAQQRLNRLGKHLGPAARWVFADACSLLVRANYLEDPAQTEEWAALATQVGEQRVRPLAQLSRLSLLTRDLAWLEVRRLYKELDHVGYQKWLDRTTRRHGFVFARPLKQWHSQHQPLSRGIPELFSDQPPPRHVLRRVTGHELPSCLAAVEDLSCLPWLCSPTPTSISRSSTLRTTSFDNCSQPPDATGYSPPGKISTHHTGTDSPRKGTAKRPLNVRKCGPRRRGGVP